MRHTLASVIRFFLACSVVVLFAPAAARSQSAAQGQLTVVSAGPSGEIASLDEANEVRVIFSEPMVALGRIPEPVRAPFFKISPAVKGTFRWSGTTILIFTPEQTANVPFATPYTVTIDASAQAVSGRRLAQAYTFTFTTPTVHLLSTMNERRGRRADGNVVLILRFNQRVRPGDVAAHVTAHFAKHDWTAPTIPAAAQARMNALDPGSVDRFNAKVAAVAAAAAATAPVTLKLASTWDTSRWPPSPDQVVLETVTPVPSDSWVQLTLDANLPSPAGRAVPGHTQDYRIETESTFFVDGFACTARCEPNGYNHLQMRSPVVISQVALAASLVDISSPAHERPLKPARPVAADHYPSRTVALSELGYDDQPPATTWAMSLAPTLRSDDGQTLGYTWVGTVENWHEHAFTSFGGGQGVWESTGGTVLPFYARNFLTVTQWTQAVPLGRLMSVIEQLRPRFDEKPDGPGAARKLAVKPDVIQSYGLDMKKALGATGTGLVWAAIEEGQPIPRAHTYWNESRTRAMLVQATNLGITVKDSPQNTLVFVTRLDNGTAVPDARVSIIKTDESVFWTGTTDKDGIAIAPGTALRSEMAPLAFHFIVTAEKDGDIAYTASDWHEGIDPYDFNVNFDLSEAEPLLRGSVFADRGVYRAGEEVHLKAILRHNTPQGIKPLEPGTRVAFVVTDALGRRAAQQVAKVGRWSSVETAFTLPPAAALGDYSVIAAFERDVPAQAEQPREVDPEDEEGERGPLVPPNKSVRGSFLVAAYRRPDFRVDVKLPEEGAIAGSPVRGTISARYLFGAPMGGRPVTWSWKPYGATPPDAINEHFPFDTWAFVTAGAGYGGYEANREEGTLGKDGTLAVDLDTTSVSGPTRYVLEADVEDVSRQHISNRAGVVIHPAPFYVGVRRPSYFIEQKNGLKSALVAVTLEGRPVAGVKLEVALTRTQWQSVRRAQANGFYTWETTRQDVAAGHWTFTSGDAAVPFETPLTEGGYYHLEVVGSDSEGHRAMADERFYVLGDGYTAWERYDHNRIDLVPERQTFRPGDSARILIRSPWEKATALVTTEREGIRSHEQFALTSTQQWVSVPITEKDIPNLFVSVLLVRGRSGVPPSGVKADEDLSDPGKPSFRLGYTELKVENLSKRLKVDVRANQAEFRPAAPAQVSVEVTDRQGGGAPSEVTLWAVDYGVLSLTNYQTPDVLDSVYVPKALQVITTDNRQRIVERRVLTPKGGEEPGGGGGGGAAEEAAAGVRKDFRVLAFWLGSVVTGPDGRASVNVKLPEALTTYRIMAVAGDLQSRFGSGDSEVRINKPVTMKHTFPRFLAVGDTAYFGAVITNQLREAGNAKVTIKSFNPDTLLITDAAEQTVQLPAEGSLEVRFTAAARTIGNARIQMTVRMGKESDAFEDVIPVEVLASPETVAAYGEATDARPTPSETLVVPPGVVAGFGGLHLELASTAMVGLSEGAAYLVEYPHGCAEQRGSKALALSLAADLGDAFHLAGMDPPKMRAAVQEQMKALENFQCANGGFAYWTDSCPYSSEYLTAYLLHVFKVASDLKYSVDPDMTGRAYDYLEQRLATPPPGDQGWWPAYTAWQTFAVKVLAEGGRNQDSNITRLYGYLDRMPVFALAYLRDALVASGEKSGARFDELQRRMTNAILPEAGSAHIEELSDDHLLWFWNSNVRSTAIVLNTLARSGGGDAIMRQLVRWLITVRKDGRWSNTQENAMAMEALVSYYRKYEAVVPAFIASARLGGQELARSEFKGRSTQAKTTDVPMAQVLTKGKPGTSLPLTFSRDGAGTLFYTARLRYMADATFQQGMDNGIRVERSYAPYVENGQPDLPPSISYKAGDLIRVTLTLYLTKERRYVALTDPLPAGFEPIESWFATTASALARATDEQTNESGRDWWAWWARGGFDHVERKDDRVDLFATRLGEGKHTFSYIVRATTAGTFRTAPAHGEEMYEPEVFGRTATTVVEVKR